MSRLFAAYGIVISKHIFKNIAVADTGYRYVNVVFFGKHFKTDIGHNRYNRGIVCKFFAVFQVLSKQGNKFIAVNKVSVFVNRKAAVGVAVKREAKVHLVADNKIN